MCEVPVFFATTEGQTRRIAERIAERVCTHGLTARAVEIGSADAAKIDWNRVRGVALGASLHAQRHQRRAVNFARQHARELNSRPSVFVSVSLAAASKNPEGVAAARKIAETFCQTTGWQPRQVATVAGRLAYTQYGWLIRYFMRRIAIKEGGSGDTSRDHEYTDWTQVAGLADTLVAEIRRVEQGLIPASA